MGCWGVSVTVRVSARSEAYWKAGCRIAFDAREVVSMRCLHPAATSGTRGDPPRRTPDHHGTPDGGTGPQREGGRDTGATSRSSSRLGRCRAPPFPLGAPSAMEVHQPPGVTCPPPYALGWSVSTCSEATSSCRRYRLSVTSDCHRWSHDCRPVLCTVTRSPASAALKGAQTDSARTPPSAPSWPRNHGTGGVAMAEEIESISGLSQGGNSPWFVVVYTNGEEEHRAGTAPEANRLAVAAGLHLVPTSPRVFKWVRDPDAWRRPHRAGE